MLTLLGENGGLPSVLEVSAPGCVENKFTRLIWADRCDKCPHRRAERVYFARGRGIAACDGGEEATRNDGSLHLLPNVSINPAREAGSAWMNYEVQLSLVKTDATFCSITPMGLASPLVWKTSSLKE